MSGAGTVSSVTLRQPVSMSISVAFEGVLFKTSHEIAGKSVTFCTSKNCQLLYLSLDELRSINLVFDNDVYKNIRVENSIKIFVSYGSTGSVCLAEQLDYWIKKLDIK